MRPWAIGLAAFLGVLSWSGGLLAPQSRTVGRISISPTVAGTPSLPRETLPTSDALTAAEARPSLIVRGAAKSVAADLAPLRDPFPLVNRARELSQVGRNQELGTVIESHGEREQERDSGQCVQAGRDDAPPMTPRAVTRSAGR
jgi:hypothetical protein